MRLNQLFASAVIGSSKRLGGLVSCDGPPADYPRIGWNGFPPARIPHLQQNRSMPSVRMDKGLWAARFFTTRALAARACELGRIQSNGRPTKAAREVRIGDMLRVTNDGGDFQIGVLLLSEVRGPAPVAQTLYRETEASRELRLKVAAERNAMKQFEDLPAGRTSKRDRRKIIQFRGRA
jgi:ribosome-associated heat shock protein Hsp15